MTCAAREKGRRRRRKESRSRIARGWGTDKDKVRAKVGSWARKWWVVVVRVAENERAREENYGKEGKRARGLRIPRGEEEDREARGRGARSRLF